MQSTLSEIGHFLYEYAQFSVWNANEAYNFNIFWVFLKFMNFIFYMNME